MAGNYFLEKESLHLKLRDGNSREDLRERKKKIEKREKRFAKAQKRRTEKNIRNYTKLQNDNHNTRTTYVHSISIVLSIVKVMIQNNT